jgi:hypothetical protein
MLVEIVSTEIFISLLVNELHGAIIHDPLPHHKNFNRSFSENYAAVQILSTRFSFQCLSRNCMVVAVLANIQHCAVTSHFTQMKINYQMKCQ